MYGGTLGQEMISYNYGEKRVGWVKHPRLMFWILASSFVSEILAAGAIISLFLISHSTGVSPLVEFSNALGGVKVFTPARGG